MFVVGIRTATRLTFSKTQNAANHDIQFSDAARPLSRSERERRVSARLHRGSAANATSAEMLAPRSGGQVSSQPFFFYPASILLDPTLFEMNTVTWRFIFRTVLIYFFLHNKKICLTTNALHSVTCICIRHVILLK